MLEWQLAPFVARGLRAPEGHVRYHAKLVHVVHKCNRRHVVDAVPPPNLNPCWSSTGSNARIVDGLDTVGCHEKYS